MKVIKNTNNGDFYEYFTFFPHPKFYLKFKVLIFYIMIPCRT